MIDVYYFGCWGGARHFLHKPGGVQVYDDRIVHYGDTHIDSTLAPRISRWDNALVWEGRGGTQAERDRIGCSSQECPQGQFLLHHMSNGFTAISWWDRTQGDTRGACNSTILMRGVHSSEVMLEALRIYFPEVLANLTKAGITLVEVRE